MTPWYNRASFAQFSKLLSTISILLLMLMSSGCGSIHSQKNQIEAAHINVRLGMLYLQQGCIEVAKSKLLLAQKQASQDAIVHDALGYFFSHTGELNIAVRHYLYAIKVANDKGIFWHNFGKFLYRQGHYKEALGYFLHAARDFNYLYVSDAYADASKAAEKLHQDNLAKQYHVEAIAHGAGE